MSATLRVTGDPDSIAIPRSAFLSDRASFVPSPTIATYRPDARRAVTRRSLCAGVARPKTVPGPGRLGELAVGHRVELRPGDQLQVGPSPACRARAATVRGRRRR